MWTLTAIGLAACLLICAADPYIETSDDDVVRITASDIEFNVDSKPVQSVTQLISDLEMATSGVTNNAGDIQNTMEKLTAEVTYVNKTIMANAAAQKAKSEAEEDCEAQGLMYDGTECVKADLIAPTETKCEGAAHIGRIAFVDVSQSLAVCTSKGGVATWEVLSKDSQVADLISDLNMVKDDVVKNQNAIDLVAMDLNTGLEQLNDTIKNNAAMEKAKNNAQSKCEAVGLVHDGSHCVKADLIAPMTTKCDIPSHIGRIAYVERIRSLAVCTTNGVTIFWEAMSKHRTHELMLDFTDSNFHYSRLVAIPQMSEFTITFWAKFDAAAAGAGRYYVVSYAVSAANNNAILIQVHPNVQLLLTSAVSTAEGKFPRSDGEWHHYAFAWHNDKDLRMYIDGGLIKVHPGFNSGKTVAAGGTLVLGQESDGVESGFDLKQAFYGQLTQAQVFTRQLNQMEVLEEMCGGLTSDFRRWEDFLLDVRGPSRLVKPSTLPATTFMCPHDYDLLFTSTNDNVDDFARASTLPSLDQITVGFWMKFNQFVNEPTIISYANSASSNAIMILFRPDKADLCFTDCKQITAVKLGASPDWNHVTFTFDKTTGTGKIYINGQFTASDSTYPKNTIAGGGQFILGQEQDAVGGDFNPQQRLVGRVTQVEVFDRVLSDQEIYSLTCDTSLRGNALTWTDFQNDITGENVFKVPTILPQRSSRCPNDFDIAFEHTDAAQYASYTSSASSLTGITMTAWVKPRASKNQNYFISYAYGSNTNAFTLSINEPIQLIVGGTETINTAGSLFPDDDDWHSILATWNSVSGKSYIYVDGVLQKESTTSRTAPFSGSGTWILGQEQDAVAGGFDVNQRFEGRMTDLNVYGKYLSEAEIAAVYCGDYSLVAADIIVPWAGFRNSVVGDDIMVLPTGLSHETFCKAT